MTSIKEALLERGFQPDFVKTILETIKDTDTPEVIRCENCKHYDGKWFCKISGVPSRKPYDFCSKGERKKSTENMTNLIERAFEIHDALKNCTNTSSATVCRQCPYFKKRFENNECYRTLMTDAAKAIKSLIEETYHDDLNRQS